MSISTIYISSTVVDLLYSILTLSLFILAWRTYKSARGGIRKFRILLGATGVVLIMFVVFYLTMSLSTKVGIVDNRTTNRYLITSEMKKERNHYVITQENGVEFRIERSEVRKKSSSLYLVYNNNFEWKGNLVEDEGDLFFKDCVKEFNLFGTRVCSYYNEVYLTEENYNKLQRGETVVFE